ncbi:MULTISPECIES: alpha/beta fold hydrolase [unclassified Leptospira]|uniref:alpha/beta fold hydrolase n=1 Tax=unclassified Leptospira TaxID=2633828 RepID=UPI00034DA4C6|nr:MULTISPECIES: alpha/beta fold hydrolase [unclassified Leptospira]MCR1794324.1 alpha/beta fold hydrolase [Leptospira sp. id769339]
MFKEVKLFFKEYPPKETATLTTPILILHGLFGSSKNWVSVSDFLSQYSKVYSLDLRNHGDSPHSSEHSLSVMAEDIKEFLEDHGLEKVILLGHSMGGLVAMTFTLRYPEKVEDLIIQDIAPRDYDFKYEGELTLLRTDLSSFKNRQEIDSATSQFVTNPFIRNFLLMNLDRAESGQYRWKLNVDAISRSKNMFRSEFSGRLNQYSGKVIFIIGGDSEYFHTSDKIVCLEYFPNAMFETIPGGDHYIHFTKAEEFRKILASFMDSIVSGSEK